MFVTLAWVLSMATTQIGDRYADLRGLPVSHVAVVAPKGVETQALRELIDIAPGDLLDQSEVQRGIERLYALGRFDQVRVFADVKDDLIGLRFFVEPLGRLDSLAITGARKIDVDGLRQALMLGPGDEVDSRTAATLHRRAVLHLLRVGYPLAQVEVTSNPTGEQGMSAWRVAVTEGPPVRVVQVGFTGEVRVPDALLRDAISMRPGRVLNRDVLEADQTLLKQLYISRGFLRVTISPPRIVHAEAGAQVIFDIEAGPRIAVHFRGNTAMGDDDIKALWPEPSGALAPSSLDILRQRIVQAYARLSFVGTEVEVHKLPSPLGGTEHYMVAVNEGEAVRVEAVDFKGVKAFPKALFYEQVQAQLVHDLDAQTFFEPLQAQGQRQRRAPQEPYGKAVTKVPEELRWVPSIYQQVADEVMTAYRDVGYLKAKIADPVLSTSPRFAQSPNLIDCRHVPGARRLQQSRTCDVHVQMEVDEGPQSFVESMSFRGNQAVAADQLLAEIYAATADKALRAPLLPGAPLSQNAVEDGRIEMIRFYRDQGYLYVRIFAEVVMSPDETWAKVHYAIEEGPKVHVQRVLLRGNRHTRDGIIRSRMRTKPGDLYRLEQAVTDQRAIAALGTFSTVRVKLIDEEHTADQKDLVAEVVERPRQPIEVVPGISTTDGPRLRLSYSHINVFGTASAFVASLKVNRQIFFALFGQYAENLSNRYASYHGLEQLTKGIEREGRLGLRSPPIKLIPFDPLLRLDLVDQRINAVRYSLDSTTAIFGIDMILPWRFKPSLEMQVGLTNLECPLGDNCSQNLDVRHLQGGRPIQEGEIRSIKFGPQFILDRRDNPLSATKGFFLSGKITQDFGQARPTNEFVPFSFTKYEGNLTGYVPLWHAVLAMSARAGTIQLERSSVPVDERFFLGGRDSLRGFVESTLIPQDACVLPTADSPLPAHCAEGISATPGPPLSLGGNTYMVFKTELRLPVRNAVSLDLFVDVGNLWVDFTHINTFAVRVGTGVGLRYATPVGALAIDFGINPMPRIVNAEPSTQLHFSIGSF